DYPPQWGVAEVRPDGLIYAGGVDPNGSCGTEPIAPEVIEQALPRFGETRFTARTNNGSLHYGRLFPMRGHIWLPRGESGHNAPDVLPVPELAPLNTEFRLSDTRNAHAQCVLPSTRHLARTRRVHSSS